MVPGSLFRFTRVRARASDYPFDTGLFSVGKSRSNGNRPSRLEYDYTGTETRGQKTLPECSFLFWLDFHSKSPCPLGKIPRPLVQRDGITLSNV